LIELKKIADDALELCENNGHKLSTCITVKHLLEKSFSDDTALRPAMRPCRNLKVSFLLDQGWETYWLSRATLSDTAE